MSLESLALVSQIAGGVAVIASLIFVGMQIRGQANATRAQTEQAIAANWMALTHLVSENAEPFTSGLLSVSDTFADLTDAERMRFLTTMFAMFKHYENMYLQFHKRRIANEEWEPWSHQVRMYFHQPGVQTWWRLRKSGFSPLFRNVLDASIAPDELGPVALHYAAEQQRQG